jgi:rare lipoprotein A
MASCSSTQTVSASKPKSKSKEYFAESEYGVKASPRVVADGRPVPKGGGRFMVGNPYEVRGKTYVPKEDPRYNKSGLASWYGSAFHGRVTANGEVYDSDHLSAAHPTFPLPSYARVTNTDTGTSVIVRVNDRGPFHQGRIIDVSSKAAELLDFKRIGTAHVNVQYVGRAQMDGRDMPFLMASYVRKGDRMPGIRPEGQIASGVMVASNQSFGDQLQSYGDGVPTPTAYAGRTPNGRSDKPSTTRAFAAAAQTADLAAPMRKAPVAAAPQPAARPSATQAARALPAAVPVRQPAPVAVASARPAQPSLEQQKRPGASTVRSAPATQVVQQRPQPVQVAQPSAQTAYAQPAPRAQAPVVMFGNVVLRDDGMLEQAPAGGPQKTARR